MGKQWHAVASSNARQHFSGQGENGYLKATGPRKLPIAELSLNLCEDSTISTQKHDLHARRLCDQCVRCVVNRSGSAYRCKFGSTSLVPVRSLL